MELSIGKVAAILGTSCGAPDLLVRGYSIDSRTAERGQLFFAIRGPRFDGHEFVGQAFERGVAAAVVEQAFLQQAPAALLPALVGVFDTSEALQKLGQAVRRIWGRCLIAVTGSAGKTTTKEMIAALLGERLSVHKSPGNLNNQYGLPLALLALEPHHEVAVFELAMSARGEIARLARIAEPQVGVVTNVAPVHLQYFDSVEAIAGAKRELIENLMEPSVAVLNYDDVRVLSFAEGFSGRVVTFGFGERADFRAVELEARGGESVFQVRGPKLTGGFRLHLAGWHNVENALAALATASLFDIALIDLQRALAKFQNLHQRSEILTLPGAVTVINDSYNSNPRAMERILETLAAWPVARRRIVVAGEMLELGSESPEWHRKIGRKCAQIHADWLLAVQGDARFFIEGAAEAGFPTARARFFPNAAQAGEFCQSIIGPGDVILVKGSRGVRLEAVTELLVSRAEGGQGSPVPRQGNAGRRV